jgi:hypothetical protein
VATGENAYYDEGEKVLREGHMQPRPVMMLRCHNVCGVRRNRESSRGLLKTQKREAKRFSQKLEIGSFEHTLCVETRHNHDDHGRYNILSQRRNNQGVQCGKFPPKCTICEKCLFGWHGDDDLASPFLFLILFPRPITTNNEKESSWLQEAHIVLETG